MKYILLLIYISVFFGCKKEIKTIEIKNPMVICLEIDTTTKEVSDCKK